MHLLHCNATCAFVHVTLVPLPHNSNGLVDNDLIAAFGASHASKLYGAIAYVCVTRPAPAVIDHLHYGDLRIGLVCSNSGNKSTGVHADSGSTVVRDHANSGSNTACGNNDSSSGTDKSATEYNGSHNSGNNAAGQGGHGIHGGGADLAPVLALFAGSKIRLQAVPCLLRARWEKLL